MGKASGEVKLVYYLNNVSKRSQKEALLDKYKGSQKLKNIFVYALDPYRRYFVRQIPETHIKGGTKYINGETWQLLDRIASRQVTGNDARRLICEHMDELISPEALAFYEIVLRKLRVGVNVKTINKIWPGAIKERALQKARAFEAGKVTYPVLAGLKLDGIRAEYVNGGFISRNGRPLLGLDHLQKPCGLGHWDGELIVPSMMDDFDAMSGHIRSLGDTPDVRYVIFDDITLRTLPQKQRYDILSRRFPPFTLKNMDKLPLVTYLPHYLLDSYDEIMELFAAVRQLNQEGIVIKRPRFPYQAGRNYNWMKLKKGFEREYEIVDVYEGDGKFKGMLGGVTVQITPTTTTNVGSGFSDKARVDYWLNPHKVLGRLATITAMERTKDGSLRHPVFKTVRWDI